MRYCHCKCLDAVFVQTFNLWKKKPLLLRFDPVLELLAVLNPGS